MYFIRVLENLSTPCPVPKRRLIIAWFFSQSAVLTQLMCVLSMITKRCYTPDNHGKANKKSNLSGRIGYHYRLNAEGSRLGILLTEESGYQVRRMESGR